ncbi:MAG: metal-dependent transcriptional regulator [Candidatus Zixiibacteriota bacterium]
MLTATQQDYIEVIYQLITQHPPGGVRVSDIAGRLGTRMPTVTRTVRKLTQLGFLVHQPRRSVELTAKGTKVARAIRHRHEDLVTFFTEILNLPLSRSEADACQIEHGLSVQSSQRLHEFLNYVGELSDEQRQIIMAFRSRKRRGSNEFRHLPKQKVDGWRG